MNIKNIWHITNPSICQIIHKKSGRVVSAGTGFKSEDLIVTNNHVYNPLNSDEIIIQFKLDDGKKIKKEKNYSSEQFQSLLVEGMHKDLWDFALLNDSYFEDIPNLTMSNDNIRKKVGQKCVFLGYPFSSNYLTIHKAIISAKYTKINNEVKYIQLDANVNSGNSGGPLINKKTLEVIGIITLKNTGFSERFNELKQSFAMNSKNTEKYLNESEEFIGQDFVRNLMLTQDQLSIMAKEIERSSNVGIGYAFDLQEIIKSINNYKSNL